MIEQLPLPASWHGTVKWMPLFSWPSKKRKLDIAWLTDDLAVGSAPLDEHWQSILDAGVGAVLEVRSEEKDDTSLLEEKGIPHRREEVPDYGAPSLADLDSMVSWIQEQMRQHRKVLVHCRYGLGRSAMVCCATLISLGFPVDVAYNMLRSVRPNVSLSVKQVNALESLAVLVNAEKYRGLRRKTLPPPVDGL